MPFDQLDPAVAAATGAPAVDTDQVVSVTPHDVDPAWSVVTFADGRTETRPTSEAAGLPKAAPEGPPPPPVGAGVQPGVPTGPLGLLSAGAPGGALPTEAGLVATAQAGGAPEGGVLDAGVRLAPGAGPGTPPPAQVDPGARVVSAGGASEAPYATTDSRRRTEEEFAVDPAATAAQSAAGYAGLEEDVAANEANQLAARRVENDAAEQAAADQLTQQREGLRKAAIFTEESRKAVQVVEDTPIEEDFYADAPGRQVAAWVALALSGFLQGATKGANPALNQMMQSLNAAQERFVANQRANKNSKLQLRMQGLGDAKAAEASIRMQIPGLIEKHAQLAAQKAGLNELVPGVSTAVAAMRVKGMEAQQQFAQHPVARTERRIAEERRAATPGPTFQGDVELQQLGVDRKAHADAMDPKGANLGGMVQGAQRMQRVGNELQAIAKRHGGDLPNQNLISYSTVGADRLAARMGSSDAADQVRAKQLLEELKLAWKQTINIKSVDSENEGKNFNAMIDTGTTAQTLQAVAEKIQETNERAITTASGYSRNPQGYVEFVARTLRANRGTSATSAPTPKRSTGFKVDAPAQPAAPGAGGAAEAEAPKAPSGLDPAPAQTGFRRGTYQRLRG